jgi:F-type H+-transporting ATPase subunit c
MDNVTLIAMASIFTAGLTIALGSIGPALGEGRAVATALTSLAQQPDAASTITRTLFVGLAMIESIAIYCSKADFAEALRKESKPDTDGAIKPQTTPPETP